SGWRRWNRSCRSPGNSRRSRRRQPGSRSTDGGGLGTIPPRRGHSGQKAGSMTLYEWYLLAHILGAVVWVGGAASTSLMAWRIQASGDRLQLAHTTGFVEWIGSRVFAPVSLFVILMGVLMV